MTTFKQPHVPIYDNQLNDQEASALKQLLNERLNDLGWKPIDLAREYGRLREKREDIDPERYRGAVKKVLDSPDGSQFATVRLMLLAMGITLQAVVEKKDL